MPRLIDLSGQQFDKLTVIERSGSTPQGRPMWKCQCECGEICFKSRDYLKSKLQTKSCGCQSKTILKEFNKTKIKDLTGQRFNKLVVIEDSGKRCCGNVIWKCKCDCGNECEVSGNKLLSGQISCGCALKEFNKTKIKDLTGQRFGKLTVIEDSGERRIGNVIWKCKCDCGNEHFVAGGDLQKGYVQSCGCLGKSKGEWKIRTLLDEAEIEYTEQYNNSLCRFEDTDAVAYFDFFIENKYIIEYDGIQHFEGWNGDKDNLIYNQKHDEVKNQWCKKNNIPLIRIPYTHYDNLCLDDLLLETSEFIMKD